MRIHSFEQFESDRFLRTKLLRALHEGVRVVRAGSAVNESSNMESFAQRELDIVVRKARKDGDRAIIEDFVPEILALVDRFGNSGQSGGSAPYTAGAIVHALKKLIAFEPIAPVMNGEDEWSDSFAEGKFQNKRCSALFREGTDGDPYYLDAIVWKTPRGATYTGTALSNGETVRSRQFVREFPFEPRTFVIDVDEREIAPDDWEFHVRDPKQLEEVFKYYRAPKGRRVNETEQFPSVLTLGDGTFTGILQGYTFTTESGKYRNTMGVKCGPCKIPWMIRIHDGRITEQGDTRKK